jgi:translation initiation factor IF-3
LLNELKQRNKLYRRADISKDRKIRINEEIAVPKIRVIDSDGAQLGILSPREAIQIAERKGLDLLEIVPNVSPPVCKIIDFGKYKYEQQKKEKLQKKNQIVVQLKEVRFHPNTDEHDFEFKSRHARNFILEGHKVKAVVIFKGREITYQEYGAKVIERLTERLSDIAKVDQPGHMEGKSMIIIYSPDKTKKKSELKTETKKIEEK